MKFYKLASLLIASLTILGCQAEEANNRSRAVANSQAAEAAKSSLEFNTPSGCFQKCVCNPLFSSRSGTNIAGYIHSSPSRNYIKYASLSEVMCGQQGDAAFYTKILARQCGPGETWYEQITCPSDPNYNSDSSSPSPTDSNNSSSPAPQPPSSPIDNPTSPTACPNLCEDEGVLLGQPNVTIATICHSMRLDLDLSPLNTWRDFKSCYRDNVEKLKLPYGQNGSTIEGGSLDYNEKSCLANLSWLRCGKMPF